MCNVFLCVSLIQSLFSNFDFHLSFILTLSLSHFFFHLMMTNEVYNMTVCWSNFDHVMCCMRVNLATTSFHLVLEAKKKLTKFNTKTATAGIYYSSIVQSKYTFSTFLFLCFCLFFNNNNDNSSFLVRFLQSTNDVDIKNWLNIQKRKKNDWHFFVCLSFIIRIYSSSSSSSWW